MHRDLKPDNILVNRAGEPVLTDFGLARESARGTSQATQDGVILGSPSYMPPEQAAGNLSEMGPTSDVYSLGVVLYQMLTGDLPFRGSVVEVLANVLMKTPKPVREAKPDADPGLSAICEKMIAKKPQDRYQSMTDVANALAEWLKSPAKAATVSPAKRDESSGDLKVAEPATKSKLGTTHSIAPKQTGAEKSKQTISPGKAKVPERTPQQLAELAELIDQLLVRNDYLEAIRIVEEIPDYQRTAKLRKLLGEAYQLKSTVEKLERNLEKHLNLLDIPALKKCVDQLLKLRPSHPRGKEIKKALNTEGKRGVVKLRKESSQFDAVGNVWEPWKLATGVGVIALLGVVAYFAVTIYIKTSTDVVQIEIDDPTAVVKVDGRTVEINSEGLGEIRLTLGEHEYTATSGDTSVTSDGKYVVKKDGKVPLKIILKPAEPEPSAVASTEEKPEPVPDEPIPVEPLPAAADAPLLAVAPFDADEAKAHQEAWAKHLGVPVEYTNPLGMKFRLIPPGEFLMGRTPEEIQRVQNMTAVEWERKTIGSQGPAVRTVLRDPYYLAADETTVGQFRLFVQSASYQTTSQTSKTGSKVPRRNSSGFQFDPKVHWSNWYAKQPDDDMPVVCVTAADVHALCDWLRQTENAAYRLPTPAEWEYACRAGTTTLFWSGDDEATAQQHEWIGLKDQEQAFAVGQKSANPFGLFDMQGNVQEWSENEDGRYQERSGYCGFPSYYAHSANRIWTNAEEPQSKVGFRLLLPVEAVQKSIAAANGDSAAASSLESYHGPFEILEAKYGTKDQSADLTERMQAAAKDGLLVAFVEQELSSQKFGGELTLKWKAGGEVREDKVPHRRFAFLDARPVPESPPQGLAIHDAYFGTGILGEGQMVDVKEPLAKLVKDNVLDVDAKEFNSKLPDPAVGKSKVLIVRYALDGEVRTELFEEQGRLKLGG